MKVEDPIVKHRWSNWCKIWLVEIYVVFFKLLFLLFDFFFNIKKNDIFFFLESFFSQIVSSIERF